MLGFILNDFKLNSHKIVNNIHIHSFLKVNYLDKIIRKIVLSIFI